MSTTPTTDTERSKGLAASFRRLYYGQTNIEFVRRKKIWFTISGIVILAGVLSLATRGLNFDIEFVGGTSWQVPANGATVTDARNAVSSAGLGGATITTLGSGKNEQISVEAKITAPKGTSATAFQNKVSEALAKATHHSSDRSVTVQSVGPTWGSQITHKAVEALIVFFILIAIYISIFFEWKMALAAIIAVMHDILVTVGIYSLTAFLVTPDTVVAFLTVLGYSLYDTIVVFDRVRDNTRGLGSSGKLSFTDVVNLSMNQTLARSINTSLVAILPILAVLLLGADVLGATTLEYFGLALLIGLASGAYSSIFIASPLVAIVKEREPRYIQIRQRLEARGAGTLLLTPAAVAAGALEDHRSESGGSRRRRKSTNQENTGTLRPGSASSPALEPEDLPSDAEQASPRSAATSRPPGSNRPSGQRPGGAGGNRPAPRPRKKRRR